MAFIANHVSFSAKAGVPARPNYVRRAIGILAVYAAAALAGMFVFLTIVAFVAYPVAGFILVALGTTIFALGLGAYRTRDIARMRCEEPDLFS